MPKDEAVSGRHGGGAVVARMIRSAHQSLAIRTISRSGVPATTISSM
jgi:hypothetical protein